MQKYFPSANVLMRDFQIPLAHAKTIRDIMRGKVCAYDPDLFPKTYQFLASAHPYPSFVHIQMHAIAEVLKLPLAQHDQTLYIDRSCPGKLTLLYDNRFRIAPSQEFAQ